MHKKKNEAELMKKNIKSKEDKYPVTQAPKKNAEKGNEAKVKIDDKKQKVELKSNLGV